MKLNHSNDGGAAPVAAANTRPTYTCPMHVEIKQVAPGICPICGMPLVIASPAQVGTQ